MTGTDRSLVDVLLRHAEARSEETLYHFLSFQGPEAADLQMSYGELEARSRAVACAAREVCSPGDRAILLYPPGLDYVAAFMGCLRAGVIAVPAYPPRSSEPDARLQTIVRDAAPAAALTIEAMVPFVESGLAAAHSPLQLVSTDGLDSGDERFEDHAARPETLAFLQYSSGSTGDPKGVMLTHGNLLDNLGLMQELVRHGPEDEAVSWLPPYHDMGLIGGILQPFFVGIPGVLMSPLDFLQDPLRWLWAIARHPRSSSSPAPNFAYDLCVRKASPDRLEGLDLSSWGRALNGAERVRADTIDRFCETFEPFGFRRTAFLPCYGLAEGTLMVTGVELDAAPAIEMVDQAALDRGSATPARDGKAAATLVGSGPARRGWDVRIVDPDTRRACPPRTVGEIWIAGPSVAAGYWERPDQTRGAFHATIEDAADAGRFLRTGDLGYLRPDGELYVVGRLNDLMVVRGRNVYPDDVERTAEAAHPGLRPGCGAAFAVESDGSEAVVVVQELDDRRRDEADAAVAAIRRALGAEQEIHPHAVVLVARGTLPKTSSGKKRRFEARERFVAAELDVVAEWRLPHGARSASATAGALSSSDVGAIEAWLAAEIGAQLGIPASRVDTVAPFAELGLDSLAGVELAERLSTWLGRALPVSLAWEYPSVAALARHLARERNGARPSRRPAAAVEPIAVVGAACRLPGARDLDQLRDLLRSGRDALSSFPRDRWDAAHADEVVADRGGFIDEVDMFDAAFFGISPREAARIDPQQRILLETAWEALEDAGQPPPELAGSDSGVFVGISNVDYLQLQDVHSADGHLATGNAHSIAANRLSYFLDLQGPSIAVDTACSSSLVAVHLARQSLALGECDVALAAGVNVLLSPEPWVALSRAGMLAPDGRCKTFDAAADGYARGEGCGVVVLKRLSDARSSGDRVLALLRGSAVNQDGRSAGLTAPNGRSQERVISSALAVAGLEPNDVGYVELHGTGTALGDAIEVHALATTFGADGDEPCLIGSVKPSIGHLESAAGIAGLLKVVAGLRHRELYPQTGVRSVNRWLPLDGTRLEISRRARAWTSARDRRVAGVSSFGFGGTNAHVVVEEPPEPEPALETAAATPRAHVLTLSAKTRDGVLARARDLDARLASGSDLDLADVCYTANARRAHFRHRFAASVSTLEQLRERLADPSLAEHVHAAPARGKVAFVCADQGVMGQELYETQPAFRAALDECDRILQAETPLRTVLCDESASIAEPAAFAFEWALARLWASFGIVPDGIVGHGCLAACLAGALELEEALLLVSGAAEVPQRPLRIPLASNLTGELVAAGESLPADYWRGPPRSQGDGLRALAEAGFDVFVELGLSAAVDVDRQPLFVPTLAADGSAWETLTRSLARLYVAGVDPDWRGVYEGQRRRLVSLPSYPFERHRHWLGAPAGARVRRPAPPPVAPRISAPMDGERVPALTAFLRTEVARALEIEPDALGLDDHLDEVGLDSLMVLGLRRRVEAHLGIEVPVAPLSEAPTLRELAHTLDAMLDGRVSESRAEVSHR
jgi:acyl-CoA synthetase (AMP-forming)/AMP-acid ligase II/3-oxoacyl-(acyl-carrier-protein) synthase/acyl carrier protein